MTSKILKNIIITAVITSLITISLFITSLYSQFTNDIKANLKEEVNYIACGLEAVGLDYFNNLTSSNRITLLGEDGKVIYDNKRDEETLENHAEREEILLAKEAGEGYSVRYSNTIGKKAIYYAKALNDDVILRVSANTTGVASMILKMSSQIFWIFVISLIVAYIIAKQLTLAIVKPINEIDLDASDQVVVYKELNPLLSKLSRQKLTINKQLDELKRSQIEFKAITSNMNEGLIVVNNRLEVLSYNDSALKLFDIDNIEINDSVYKFYHSSKFIEVLNRALDGTNQEFKINFNDKVYEIIVSPVMDKEVSGAIIIVFDYTMKERQEMMRKEFSANVSHELKTPLTSISGFAEIMMNNLVDAKDVPDIATNIYNEAQRLINLVEDIIHLSSLDSSEIEAKKEDINLKDMILSIIGYLKDSADKKDIKIEFDNNEHHYNGVYKLIEEMIYNLVDNAIKYGKDHGHININVHEDGDNLYINIKDDGIGIDASELDRIFERFYRVDKSHSKLVGGTGLGLSIVKHVALFHKGNVKVKSKLNEGTEFMVILPIKKI